MTTEIREQAEPYVTDEGVAIDQATGEVLSLPEGVTGDVFEWMTYKYMRAGLNIAGWEQEQGILKKALGRLLDESGQKSMNTKWGTPRHIAFDRQDGVPELVPAAVKAHELGADAHLLILACASALTVKKLDALRVSNGGPIPDLAINAIIEVKPIAYLRVDKPKGIAPDGLPKGEAQ